MQIILLDKVANLGNLGDTIDVKAGYARNFLIPYGKAVPASKKNIEYFKAYHSELKAKSDNILAVASARAEKISALGMVTIISKAREGGKLFGSVGIRNIADAVTAAGIKVTKNEVRLPNGVLRTIGKHEIVFQVHSGISVKLVINIIPDN